jgi:hypothetical protein
MKFLEGQCPSVKKNRLEPFFSTMLRYPQKKEGVLLKARNRPSHNILILNFPASKTLKINAYCLDIQFMVFC